MRLHLFLAVGGWDAAVVLQTTVFGAVGWREVAAEPAIWKKIPGTIGAPARRIDGAMRNDDRPMPVDFSDTFLQIMDEFFERRQLRFSGMPAIKIADEADAKRDFVEVIAVDVTALNLPHPAIADFDPSVGAAVAVVDDELIGESVWHVADVEMIVVKRFCVALFGAAVVDDDVTPAPAFDGVIRMVDCLADG